MGQKYSALWRGVWESCLFVVLMLVVVACAPGMKTAQESGSANREETKVVAARVNGAPIYEDEVIRELRADLRKYRKYSTGAIPPALTKRLREQGLDRLIAVELVYQAGQKIDIPDLEEQIDAQVEKFKTRHGSRASNWSDAELRSSIRRNIRISEYLKTVGVADPEVPEADIRRYYEEHGKKAFSRQEHVHVRHILVQVDRNAGPESKAVARRKIEQARQEILTGKDFGEVAKAYSDDNIAATGGDLSYIKRGYMPGEFDQVAFSLEINTLSDVVETEHGYHLIEVLDKKPAGVVPYEEIKGFITKHLKNQASVKKRDAVIQGLRAKAEIEIVEKR